jgi:hypothetical protein
MSYKGTPEGYLPGLVHPPMPHMTDNYSYMQVRGCFEICLHLSYCIIYCSMCLRLSKFSKL